MVHGLVMTSHAVYFNRKMGLDCIHFQKWCTTQCRNFRKNSLPQLYRCRN